MINELEENLGLRSVEEGVSQGILDVAYRRNQNQSFFCQIVDRKVLPFPTVFLPPFERMDPSKHFPFSLIRMKNFFPFPEPVLALISQYFSIQDCCNVARVCRRWNVWVNQMWTIDAKQSDLSLTFWFKRICNTFKENAKLISKEPKEWVEFWIQKLPKQCLDFGGMWITIAVQQYLQIWRKSKKDSLVCITQWILGPQGSFLVSWLLETQERASYAEYLLYRKNWCELFMDRIPIYAPQSVQTRKRLENDVLYLHLCWEDFFNCLFLANHSIVLVSPLVQQQLERLQEKSSGPFLVDSRPFEGFGILEQDYIVPVFEGNPEDYIDDFIESFKEQFDEKNEKFEEDFEENFEENFEEKNQKFEYGPVHWEKIQPKKDIESNGLHGASLNQVGNDLYLFGGAHGGWAKNQLWKFNLKTYEWNRIYPTILSLEEDKVPLSTTDDQLPFRTDHSGEVWKEKILIFGGRSHAGRVNGINTRHPQMVFNDLFCFDPSKNTWIRMNPVIKGWIPARKAHATYVYNSKMFVFGGWDNHSPFNDLHFLDLVTWTWNFVEIHSTFRPPPIRDAPFAFVENCLFIWGGGGPARKDTMRSSYYNRMFAYDLLTSEWSNVEIEGPRPFPTESHNMVAVNHFLFILGGHEKGRFNRDLYVFDTHKHVFIHLLQDRACNIPQPRCCSMLLIIDQKLWLVGGYGPYSKEVSIQDLGSRDAWVRYKDIWVCELKPILNFLIKL